MPKLATRTTMPRPNDPDIIARVADATRKGHPITTAGTMAGIGASTGFTWLQAGQEELDAGQELGPHVGFLKAVKQAEADMVDSRLDVINEAGDKGQWAAAMTLLERRMPDSFGRNQTVTVNQPSLAAALLDTLPLLAEAVLLQQRLDRLAALPRIEAGGGDQNDASPPPAPTSTEAQTNTPPDSP